MKYLFRSLFVVILLHSIFLIQAQKIEKTYNWGLFDHSNWKVQPNGAGYLMIGNKFFEPANNTLYIQGFNQTGNSLFLKSHTVTGMQMQTVWKNYIASSNRTFFTVVAGTQSGNKAYALLTDSVGNKIWDKITPLANGVQLGGVTNAPGGWIAVGSDGSGNLLAVKFDTQGNQQWTKTYPLSGFGWCIIRAQNGGYYIAGTRQVVKIDESGNQVWAKVLSLPISPDGSAYTYTEFEEIIELPQNNGIVITGSAFSNSTSAVYTALFKNNGQQSWSVIHAPQNTALSGTPVSWTNNAIQEGDYIVTSWRTGPVSAGGTLYYQYISLLGEKYIQISMGNTIPVQEAYMIKSNGKYVVGGTRGGYSASYALITSSLPLLPDRFPGFRRDEEETLPLADAPETQSGLVRANFNNVPPIYKIHPASRVFRSEMRVFPNPSINGIVNVGGRIESGATLRVTDIMGRVVLEKQINAGDTQVELDLKSQGKGIYNVEMIGAGPIASKKVIVQ